MDYKKYQKPETESWYAQGNVRRIVWTEYHGLLCLFFWFAWGFFCFAFRKNEETLTEEDIFKKPTKNVSL